MFKINKQYTLLLASAVSGLLVYGAQQVNASEWIARSPEAIAAEVKVGPNETKEYTIVWGDTLSAISSATGVSVDQLMAINTLENRDLIYPGTTIQVAETDQIVTITEVDQTPKAFDVSGKEAKEVDLPNEQAKAKEKEAETKKKETVDKKEIVEQPAPKEPVEEPVQEPARPSGRTLTVEATAYSRNEPGLSNFTANGTDLSVNPRVIAVDPNVIPLGSTVYIQGYGTYTAADTGGAIIGNRIDVHFENVNDTYTFGRQTLTLTIVE
ncbi:3D domain-containing protein [Atopobacter phocae]|uniref:3D domain-containing protein n=1 Tax=Atopobacter phocae TaxID=136492 RepID=UPI000471859E|nr:3D domain-containing protein [Atopobacter phocae]